MTRGVAVPVLIVLVAKVCASGQTETQDLDDTALGMPLHLATPTRTARTMPHPIATRSVGLRPTVRSFRPLRAEGDGKGPAIPGLEEMMKDPKYKDRAEQVKKAMADPNVMSQMQQAAAMANSPEMIAKMASLKDDPDFKPMFDAMEQGMKEGGSEKAMEAVMKFYKDPDFVAKVGEKMGATTEKLQAAVAANDNQPVIPEALQNEMAAAREMANTPEMKEKMKELRSDPELKPYFDDMEKGGQETVAKYYNDPEFLNKIAAKLGNLPEQTMAKMSGEGASEPPPVNSLLDAARYGDLEAVEDFIAVGKDVNAADNEGRAPLHMASGAGNDPIVAELIKAGANLEVIDSKGNTPLHYAAGYGRVAITKQLLDAGANVRAENNNGKMPVEVCKLNDQNPLLADQDIMSRLQGAALARSPAEDIIRMSAQALMGFFMGSGVTLAAFACLQRRSDTTVAAEAPLLSA